MEPNEVNGLVLGDQTIQRPRPQAVAPMDNGQIETADFRVTGNLRAAYQHLKEMYEPKLDNQSGPIKHITDEELEREKHKAEEDTVKQLDIQEFI